jgi:predicted nucleic acid-binding protein
MVDRAATFGPVHHGGNARRDFLWNPIAARRQAIFNEHFAGQVLSFDGDAASAYAEIAASRKNSGRPISQFDAMIAAMAYSRGASLATRKTKDFVECGIDIIDPWKE